MDGRHRHHDPQDARRRHRRRLRPAGRRGAGPHARRAGRMVARADPHPCARGAETAGTATHSARDERTKACGWRTAALAARSRSCRARRRCTTHDDRPRADGAGGDADRVEHRSDETDAEKRGRARMRLELAARTSSRGQMTTALDEVKLALAGRPDFGEAYNLRGLIYARLGDRRWPRRASSARCSSIRATPTRCTTTAGTCASRGAMPRRSALFDQVLARAAVPRCAAHAAGAGRVPGARRPAGRSRALARPRLRARPVEPVAAVNLAEVLYRRGELRAGALLHPRVNSQPEQSNAQTLWLAAQIEQAGNQQGARRARRAAAAAASRSRARRRRSSRAASMRVRRPRPRSAPALSAGRAAARGAQGAGAASGGASPPRSRSRRRSSRRSRTIVSTSCPMPPSRARSRRPCAGR